VRRPPGELGLAEAAHRLGMTPARLRRQAIEQRWDDVPAPVGQVGLEPYWLEADIARFLDRSEPTLRVRDIADQMGCRDRHVKLLLREQRYDDVPPPTGRDTIGVWWSPALVSEWFAERRGRIGSPQAAALLGQPKKQFQRRVSLGDWDKVPRPAGRLRHRYYWDQDEVLAWRATAVLQD
jgi:hypothetical protein